MTDELQELEPLEEAPAAEALPEPEAAAPGAPMMAAGTGGMPILGAPAFNPAAGGEYYRFLFAGIIMFIGCLMPWGGPWTSGYHSLLGAVTMVISVGMIWTWWGAIAVNRFTGKSLLWVLACVLPFLFQLMAVLSAFEMPWVKGVSGMPADWGEFFEAYFDFGKTESEAKSAAFLAAFGPGRIVVLLGALMAEAFMVMAIFGGTKKMKAQKAERSAAAQARGAAAGGGGSKGKRRR